MKPRTITIVPVLNGFIVNVGCQSVVVKTPAELGAEITKYYTNPGNTERLYKEGRVNDLIEPEIVADEARSVCTPRDPARFDSPLLNRSLVGTMGQAEPQPAQPETPCQPPKCDPRH